MTQLKTSVITLQARTDESGVLRIYSADGQPCDMIAVDTLTIEQARRGAFGMAQHFNKLLGMEPLPSGKQLKKANQRGHS